MYKFFIKIKKSKITNSYIKKMDLIYKTVYLIYTFSPL